MPPTESLKLYGYANQGNYGDVTGDRPGVFSIQDRMLWDAWAKYRGQSMDEAKVNFIKTGEDVLHSHGFPTDDPGKEQGDKDYHHCLEEEIEK